MSDQFEAGWLAVLVYSLAYRPCYVIVSTITNGEPPEFQNVRHIRIVIVNKTCRDKLDTLESLPQVLKNGMTDYIVVID